jgi:hypothetical protein
MKPILSVATTQCYLRQLRKCETFYDCFKNNIFYLMRTGTRFKCVGHLPAQGINFWVIPGQDQASRSAQNQKNGLFLRRLRKV